MPVSKPAQTKYYGLWDATFHGPPRHTEIENPPAPTAPLSGPGLQDKKPSQYDDEDYDVPPG